MTKFVVDFDSEEFKEAVKISIKERVKELTAREIESEIQRIMDIKLGRIVKKFEDMTDEKIDQMIQSEIRKQIGAFFTRRWGSDSDFSKVAEKVLREMLTKVLE